MAKGTHKSSTAILEVVLLCSLVAVDAASLNSCASVKATRVSANPLITQYTIGLNLPYPQTPQLQFPSFFYDSWALGLQNTPFPGVPADAKAVAMFGRHKGKDMYWGWTKDYLSFTLGSSNSGKIPVSWSNAALNPSVYNHISSPELFVDKDKSEIWLAFHWCCLTTYYTPLPLTGRAKYASSPQATMLAKWNGTKFVIYETKAPVSDQNKRAYNAAVAPYYLRIFKYGGKFYGTARESKTGSLLLQALNNNITGPYRVVQSILPSSRHTGLMLDGNTLYVAYTRLNEMPERALLRSADISNTDPTKWNFAGPETALLEPAMDWEGANVTFTQPASGGSDGFERNLRDPNPFFDKDQNTKMSYTGGGEYAIGLANLSCA